MELTLSEPQAEGLLLPEGILFPGTNMVRPGAWPFGLLPMFGYDLLHIDPPWDFKLYSEAGNEKSAGRQYDTMSLEEIMSYPVGQLAAADCLVLIWICEWMAPGDLQRLIDCWGLTYKSRITWIKSTKNNKIRMGTGYRVRTMHESIMVCTVGNPKHKAFKSVFHGLAREHSRKPEEFFDIIKNNTPKLTRRLDIFGRQSRPGFDVWGNQASLFDTTDVSPKQIREATLIARSAEQGELEPMPLFNLIPGLGINA